MLQTGIQPRSMLSVDRNDRCSAFYSSCKCVSNEVIGWSSLRADDRDTARRCFQHRQIEALCTVGRHVSIRNLVQRCHGLMR